MGIIPVKEGALVSDVGSVGDESDGNEVWENDEDERVDDTDKPPTKLWYNGEGKQHELLDPPSHEIECEKHHALLPVNEQQKPKVSYD